MINHDYAYHNHEDYNQSLTVLITILLYMYIVTIGYSLLPLKIVM